MKDDCSRCRKRGKVCRSTDWFLPSEIRYCRVQMMWMIEYIGVMGEGIWPENPDGSDYVDIPINIRRGKSGAYFETPAGYAGEIRARLEPTGVDGKLLKSQIWEGKTLDELEPEARTALNYISGWRFRRMDYKSWLRQKRYRIKRR